MARDRHHELRESRRAGRDRRNAFRRRVQGRKLNAARDALRTSTGVPTLNPVFEMTIFNAERHTTESNFFLTLGNFVKRQSVCTSICNDGIVTPVEQCDLGAANTSPVVYGGCQKDTCTPRTLLRRRAGERTGDLRRRNEPRRVQRVLADLRPRRRLRKRRPRGNRAVRRREPEERRRMLRDVHVRGDHHASVRARSPVRA